MLSCAIGLGSYSFTSLMRFYNLPETDFSARCGASRTEFVDTSGGVKTRFFFFFPLGLVGAPGSAYGNAGFAAAQHSVLSGPRTPVCP